MPRYRVKEGEKLSHSIPVERGYEGRTFEAGDELELPEQDGKRLVDAGVLEAAGSKKGKKK